MEHKYEHEYEKYFSYEKYEMNTTYTEFSTSAGDASNVPLDAVQIVDLSTEDIRFFTVPVQASVAYTEIPVASSTRPFGEEIVSIRRALIRTIKNKSRLGLLCSMDVDHAMRDIIALCALAGVVSPDTQYSWSTLHSHILTGHEREQAAKILQFLSSPIEAKLPQALPA
jgi:hypothetical protein